MTDIIKTARKTNLDTTLLRTLVAISDCGGFSEAAQALHLTQSAVSHHVRRLEEQLGNTFFETQGRRRRLTESGELFYGTRGKFLPSTTKLSIRSGSIVELQKRFA